jgi:ferric-dicitrate binding protein FerR (iron transport regulator)
MFNQKSLQYFLYVIFLCLFSSCSNVIVETDDTFNLVELPDGSIAYLNQYSSIKYDKDFDPRSIKVHGEVFLSVTEKEIPFIIETYLAEITVLGTELNVKSAENETEVEVEEGSVRLKTDQHENKVTHGESAVFKKGGNGIKKGKAEFKFKIWKKSLEIEFKKLGKEIKRSSKEIGKESKKVAKQLNKKIMSQ